MTLLVLGAIIAFGVGFPRAANVAAWLLTLLVILPLTFLAFGSVGYVLNEVVGPGLSGRTAFVGSGAIAAAAVGRFILKD